MNTYCTEVCKLEDHFEGLEFHHVSHDNNVAADVLSKMGSKGVSYGPPWAHYLGGYQDRLLGGPLGLPGLRYTVPEGVEHKDYTRVVLG
jgi:hypothetical protein